MNKILTTENYSIFKKLPENRDVVDDAKVKRLMKDIQEHGLLNEILVNDRMQVLDGQHRLEALKRLNMPVSYRIINDAALPEVIALNNTQTRWNTNNYIDAYARQGDSSYLALERWCKEYSDIGTTAVLRIMTNGDGGRGLKTGDVHIIDNIPDGIQMLNILRTIKAVRGNGRQMHSFARAVWHMYAIEEVSLKELEASIKLHGSNRNLGLEYVDGVQAAIKALKQVYNYRRKVKI